MIQNQCVQILETLGAFESALRIRNVVRTVNEGMLAVVDNDSTQRILKVRVS